MGSTLIIGVGNELRGDDAAGVVAANRLADLHPEATLVTVQQLAADLALGLGDHDTVIFLDADVDAEDVSCRPVRPRLERRAYDPHHMTPAQLLAIARTLDEPLPRRAFSIGLPVRSFDHGDPLSPTAASGIVNGLRQASALLRADAESA